MRFNRKTKEEKNLDALEESLTEAWLRNHLLSRFVRFLLVIFIAFFATTGFVQANNRETCETSKVFLKSYVSFVDGAKKARETDAKLATTEAERQNNINTARLYDEQIKLLTPGVNKNCAKDFPITPLLGL